MRKRKEEAEKEKKKKGNKPATISRHLTYFADLGMIDRDENDGRTERWRMRGENFNRLFCFIILFMRSIPLMFKGLSFDFICFILLLLLVFRVCNPISLDAREGGLDARERGSDARERED